MLFDKLRAIDMFSGLTEPELKDVDSFVEFRTMKEGEILFREGDVCRDIFIVLEGRFNILIRKVGSMEIDDSGMMATVKSGEIIGELSFLDGAPRSATVQVRNEASILRIPYDPLTNFFRDNPVPAYKIIHKISIMLATRVRDVNLKLRNSLLF